MAEVTFWNVGDGNCTIIKCPSYRINKGYNVWIIDCGSRKHPVPVMQYALDLPHHRLTTRQILASIISWIFTPPELHEKLCSLNFIVSHADSDHTNFLPDLTWNLKNQNLLKELNPKKIRLFVNVHNEESYNLLLKDPDFVSDFEAKKIFESDTSKNWDFDGNMLSGYTEDRDYFGFIGRGTSSNNPNDQSLIVYFKYGAFSTLIMGDATEKTFDPNDLPKCTILLASHHGAATEGSNSKELFVNATPTYLVYSSHLVSIDHHPNPEITNRVLAYRDKHNNEIIGTRMDYHLLATKDFVSPATFIQPISQITSDQFSAEAFFQLKKECDAPYHTIYSTCRNIFHTGSNGIITFSWTKEGSFGLQFRDYKVANSNNRRKRLKTEENKDEHKEEEGQVEEHKMEQEEEKEQEGEKEAEVQGQVITERRHEESMKEQEKKREQVGVKEAEPQVQVIAERRTEESVKEQEEKKGQVGENEAADSTERRPDEAVMEIEGQTELVGPHPNTLKLKKKKGIQEIFGQVDLNYKTYLELEPWMLDSRENLSYKLLSNLVNNNIKPVYLAIGEETLFTWLEGEETNRFVENLEGLVIRDPKIYTEDFKEWKDGFLKRVIIEDANKFAVLGDINDSFGWFNLETSNLDLSELPILVHNLFTQSPNVRRSLDFY